MFTVFVQVQQDKNISTRHESFESYYQKDTFKQTLSTF